jgi:hypothetical protein
MNSSDSKVLQGRYRSTTHTRLVPCQHRVDADLFIILSPAASVCGEILWERYYGLSRTLMVAARPVPKVSGRIMG